MNWIIKRGAVFIGIYILLLICAEFGGLKNVIQSHVKSVATMSLSTVGNGGEVEFKDIKTKKDKNRYKKYDILVKMSSKQQKDRARAKAKKEGKKQTTYNPLKFAVNSWVHFGMALCFFIAFVVALPTKWKNKLLTFGVGFVFLELFLIFKLWVSINLKYAVRYEEFEVGWTNPLFIETLNHISNIVTFPYFSFLMISVLSILFCYKKSEQTKPVLANYLPKQVV